MKRVFAVIVIVSALFLLAEITCARHDVPPGRAKAWGKAEIINTLKGLTKDKVKDYLGTPDYTCVVKWIYHDIELYEEVSGVHLATLHILFSQLDGTVNEVFIGGY
jgi:hypothetical protein